MSFNVDNFQPVGGTELAGSAPQLFSYSTTDLIAAVETSQYFATAVPWGVRKGDFILVDGSGAATAHAGMYNVTAVTLSPPAITLTKLVRVP